MRISSIGCNNPLSMTCCICEVLPAVMLDMVHAASFWILILGCFNRLWNALRQLWSKTNCVWWSSPVTTLPMARNAGVITGTSLLLNNSTSLGTTPEKEKKIYTCTIINLPWLKFWNKAKIKNMFVSPTHLLGKKNSNCIWDLILCNFRKKIVARPTLVSKVIGCVHRRNDTYQEIIFWWLAKLPSHTVPEFVIPTPERLKFLWTTDYILTIKDLYGRI